MEWISLDCIETTESKLRTTRNQTNRLCAKSEEIEEAAKKKIFFSQRNGWKKKSSWGLLTAWDNLTQSVSEIFRWFTVNITLKCPTDPLRLSWIFRFQKHRMTLYLISWHLIGILAKSFPRRLNHFWMVRSSEHCSHRRRALVMPGKFSDRTFFWKFFLFFSINSEPILNDLSFTSNDPADKFCFLWQISSVVLRFF